MAVRKYRTPLQEFRDKERQEKNIEAWMRARWPNLDELRAENIARIKRMREARSRYDAAVRAGAELPPFRFEEENEDENEDEETD